MADVKPPAKKEQSRLACAFKEPFNLIPMAVAVVTALGLGITMPVVGGAIALVAALAESGYLAVIPRSAWYRRRFAAKSESEPGLRWDHLKKQIGPQLRPGVVSRMNRLESTRKHMDDQVSNNTPRYQEVLVKVDYLMEKFLQFAGREQEFRQYLRSVLEECLDQAGAAPTARVSSKRVTEEYLPGEPPLDPADVWVHTMIEKIQKFFDEDLQALDSSRLQDPDDLSTNAIVDKRKEILLRRREYVGQIGKILVNLNHQLELMEDTLGLINDELRARTPEQVLADIDDVVYKADALMDILDEVAPNNPMPAKYAPDAVNNQQINA